MSIMTTLLILMYSSLCTISSMFCLTQVVTGHTHVHHNGSKSTVDLVYVAAPSIIKTCDTISPLSNSDHAPSVDTISRDGPDCPYM